MRSIVRPRALSWTLSLSLIAAVALLLALPAPDAHAADFRDLKKQYEQARKDDKRTQMARLILEIADTRDPDAAKFLLGELNDDQKARAKKQPGLPGTVRENIIIGLAKFSDDASVLQIGEAVRALKSDKEPLLALDQLDFFVALTRMTDSEPADLNIRAALAEPNNAFLKVAAIEAVRQSSAMRFTDDVLAILREQNKDWATKWVIVPINVFACLKDIVDAENKDLVLTTVDAVITWQERGGSADERVRYFAGELLKKITGETADITSTVYWRWWLQQMRTLGHVKERDKAPEKRSKTVVSPPVFDAQPVGKRFLFVVDVSLSMDLPLKINLDDIVKRKREREAPVTGKKKEGEEVEEGQDDGNPLRKLPWKDIEKKIHLAREELSRAIKDMEGDRYFAVIKYSTQHECITDGWVKATKENCGKWSRQVLKLEPEAMTNIHGSLSRAMRLSDKGDKTEQPAVDVDCILTGAHTIIFLTDGWGSWDDQSEEGKFVKDKRDPKATKDTIGSGPFIYGEHIWPDILRMNAFRKVIINTVGIGFHDKDLLEHLAYRSSGKYVDWGFEE